MLDFITSPPRHRTCHRALSALLKSCDLHIIASIKTIHKDPGSPQTRAREGQRRSGFSCACVLSLTHPLTHFYFVSHDSAEAVRSVPPISLSLPAVRCAYGNQW